MLTANVTTANAAIQYRADGLQGRPGRTPAAASTNLPGPATCSTGATELPTPIPTATDTGTGRSRQIHTTVRHSRAAFVSRFTRSHPLWPAPQAGTTAPGRGTRPHIPRQVP